MKTETWEEEQKQYQAHPFYIGVHTFCLFPFADHSGANYSWLTGRPVPHWSVELLTCIVLGVLYTFTTIPLWACFFRVRHEAMKRNISPLWIYYTFFVLVLIWNWLYLKVLDWSVSGSVLAGIVTTLALFSAFSLIYKAKPSA